MLAVLLLILGEAWTRWRTTTANSALDSAAGLTALAERKERVFRLAICTVVRDEAPYLEEWLLFHELVGVEHFFIYDDGSTDDTRAVLAPFIARGLVSYVDWRSHVRMHADADNWDCDPERLASAPDRLNNCQLRAFDDCLVRQAHQVEWMAFFDVDEFLHPTSAGDASVLAVLDRQFAHVTHSVAVVSATYGSAGHIFSPRGPVTAAYRTRAPEHVGETLLNISALDYHGAMHKFKSIVRPSAARSGHCGAHLFSSVRDEALQGVDSGHTPLRAVATDGRPLRGCGDPAHDPQHCVIRGCAALAPQWAMLRYNHYRAKSQEDYEQRAFKGVVQGSLANKRSVTSFALLDRNERHDDALWKAFGGALTARLAAHRGDTRRVVLFVVGDDRVAVPAAAAALGLAGAVADAPLLPPRCGADARDCSADSYPAAFWLSRALDDAHRALVLHNDTQTAKRRADDFMRRIDAGEAHVLQDDGLLCEPAADVFTLWRQSAARHNVTALVVRVAGTAARRYDCAAVVGELRSWEVAASAVAAAPARTLQRLITRIREEAGVRLWAPSADRLERVYAAIAALDRGHSER